MSPFVDLSHPFQDGMPGFTMKQPSGESVRFTAHIQPFLTHAQSAPFYGGRAAFEITEMRFHSSIGTYLDSPYHRFPEGRDIGALTLDELILPGVAVDLAGRSPGEAVGPGDLPAGLDFAGRAVLLHFGWDALWGQDGYFAYPFIDRALIGHLLAGGAKLVGVDTPNVDDSRDPERPAHTRFLGEGVFVVENMRNLGALLGQDFRLFAVPIRAVGAAAMPIRAFAEIQSGGP